MPVRIGNEDLPTVDELDAVPRRQQRVDPEEFMSEVFEDGDEIYRDRETS